MAQAGAGDWELNPIDITFTRKLANCAYGAVYHGLYLRSQEVAIKFLHNVQTDKLKEFYQVTCASRAAGRAALRLLL